LLNFSDPIGTGMSKLRRLGELCTWYFGKVSKGYQSLQDNCPSVIPAGGSGWRHTHVRMSIQIPVCRSCKIHWLKPPRKKDGQQCFHVIDRFSDMYTLGGI
jgi:hypothetical protein